MLTRYYVCANLLVPQNKICCYSQHKFYYSLAVQASCLIFCLSFFVKFCPLKVLVVMVLRASKSGSFCGVRSSDEIFTSLKRFSPLAPRAVGSTGWARKKKKRKKLDETKKKKKSIVTTKTFYTVMFIEFIHCPTPPNADITVLLPKC